MIVQSSPKPLNVRLNRTIANSRNSNTKGILIFGDNNDMPYVLENIVNNSPSASAALDVYKNFIAGIGFENKELEKQIIGYDNFNKPITFLEFHKQFSYFIALFNGCYVRRNINLAGKTSKLIIEDFKKCRFINADDIDYINKVAIHNWNSTRNELTGKAYTRADIKEYYIASNNVDVIEAQAKSLKGVENLTQVSFLFLDKRYIYPLSPFDSCSINCDSEFAMNIFRNNEIRNGFSKKAIVQVPRQADEENQNNIENQIADWSSPDGSKIIVTYEDPVSATGQMPEIPSVKVSTVESTMEPDLFNEWDDRLRNSILMAVKNMPRVLIDFNGGGINGLSADVITQAVNFYNGMTKNIRTSISMYYKELFNNFDNAILANEQNFSILPFTL